MSKKNPLVFMDVSIDGDPYERMVFELFYDLVPKTAENFRALFTGEKGLSSKTGMPLHYKGTFFHRIIRGSMAQAGDLLRGDGNYGESIYGDKFPDELAKRKHDEPGLLSMAVTDRDTRGSLFSITFKANHHLDRKYIAFGKLVDGIDVLEKIERYGDEEGKPLVTVKIKNCGEHQNENQISDKKKVSKLINGKDASFEANSREIRRMKKHKKSSKRRKRRRKYYTSDSDTSSDVETETSESDSESDSDISSDTSSSSDDKRKKRKRSSKRDRYKRSKKRDRKRDRRRKRRDKRSKRKSERAFGGSSGSESKSESSSDDDSVSRQDQKHKNPAHVTAETRSPEDFSLPQKKIDIPDMLVREEGEYPKENGRGQTNGIELETRSGKSADRQPDVVDDHPGKSRSRSLSPRRTLSQSMSISPKRSLSKSLSVSPKRSNSRSPSVGGSPPLVSRGSRSFSRSPIRSRSSRSPDRSVSRSPIRPKKGSSVSRSPIRPKKRSISPVRGRHRRDPTSSPPLRSPTPPRISSRKSSRKSASRSPVRSTRRSISRSSGRAPYRRSVSRSPMREPIRNSRRSYSRSPVGRGRNERSTYADRGRSTSRSPSPDGSPKRIRRGRGFSQRYSYARRYHSPDRSPVRSYRYGSRSDRDRYSSYRRSPRRHRTPLRDRTPRYRSRRSRTRSLSPSRSPIRHRNRRYSRSPVEATRDRASPRVDRRISPQSRSPSLSGSSRSRSQSPKRDSKEKSVPSSVSPPANKGLVSYVDGSPDSS